MKKKGCVICPKSDSWLINVSNPENRLLASGVLAIAHFASSCKLKSWTVEIGSSRALQQTLTLHREVSSLASGDPAHCGGAVEGLCYMLMSTCNLSKTIYEIKYDLSRRWLNKTPGRRRSMKMRRESNEIKSGYINEKVTPPNWSWIPLLAFGKWVRLASFKGREIWDVPQQLPSFILWRCS